MATRGQASRQGQWPESDSDQPTHGKSLRLPETADLAITPGMQTTGEPGVLAWPRLLLDFIESQGFTIHRDPLGETFQHGLIWLAEHAYRIFASNAVAWVHQPMGEFSIRGEYEKACGIEVESPHADELA